MLLEKIKRELSKDRNQRAIYGLGLILWTFLMWDSIIDWSYSKIFLSPSNVTSYIVPALLLVFQIIRNNKILWALIFGLVTAYFVVALYLGISDAIERSGNHVKAIDWELKDILLLLIFFGVLAIADWTIYEIKPKKLI
jgi:hypothetical protein